MILILIVGFIGIFDAKPLSNQGVITYKPFLQNDSQTVEDKEDSYSGEYRWPKESFFERNARLKATTERPLQEDYYSKWVTQSVPNRGHSKNDKTYIIPQPYPYKGPKYPQSPNRPKVQGREREPDYSNNVSPERDYFYSEIPDQERDYYYTDKNRRNDHFYGGTRNAHDYDPFDPHYRKKDEGVEFLQYLNHQLTRSYEKGYSDGRGNLLRVQKSCLDWVYQNGLS